MLRIIYRAFAAAFLGIATGCLYLHIKARLCIIPADEIIERMPDAVFDAVAFHGCKVPEKEIPIRGKIVAIAAVILAGYYNCPIVLSVGYTSTEDLMESEIYAKWIYSFNSNVRIITARDPCVCDTAEEVESSFRYFRKQGYKNVCIVGANPHLASRALSYWAKINKKDISITFVGVEIPFRYYPWELAMGLAEIFCPMNSKRREFILNLIGRTINL